MQKGRSLVRKVSINLAKERGLPMDFQTFLTTLYCIVDTFCKTQLPVPPKRVGRPTSLCVSEILTLVLFGQWAEFRSERAFYRWADQHLRDAFPTLPDYGQF